MHVTTGINKSDAGCEYFPDPQITPGATQERSNLFASKYTRESGDINPE